MFEIVTGISWFAFAGYASWYMFKAREYQPLTLNDLALTWRIHKHQTGCKASQIQDLLVRKEEVVGFKCDCGHQHLQQRLISQRIHPQLRNYRPLSIGELQKSLQKNSGAESGSHLVHANIKRI
jgi:hypothetical protein